MNASTTPTKCPNEEEMNDLRTTLKSNLLTSNNEQALELIESGESNRLNNKEWLNDSVLNYLLSQEIQNPTRATIKNTYFYNLTILKLKSIPDIEYPIIIPIHINNSHWILATIQHNKTDILAPTSKEPKQKNTKIKRTNTPPSRHQQPPCTPPTTIDKPTTLISNPKKRKKDGDNDNLPNKKLKTIQQYPYPCTKKDNKEPKTTPKKTKRGDEETTANKRTKRMHNIDTAITRYAGMPRHITPLIQLPNPHLLLKKSLLTTNNPAGLTTLKSPPPPQIHSPNLNTPESTLTILSQNINGKYKSATEALDCITLSKTIHIICWQETRTSDIMFTKDTSEALLERYEAIHRPLSNEEKEQKRIHNDSKTAGNSEGIMIFILKEMYSHPSQTETPHHHH